MIAPFLDIDRETGAQKKMDRAEQPPGKHTSRYQPVMIALFSKLIETAPQKKCSARSVDASLSISSRLAANSVASNEMPVAFPVGRARLDTIRGMPQSRHCGPDPKIAAVD
jgi:hypothetical protein